MPGHAINISLLADHPELAGTVSGWIFGEWGRLTPGSTLEKVETRFQTHLNRDRLPLTLVAMIGPIPAGTSSLVAHDISTRDDLSPWLAGVYVSPEFRNQGIGTALVREAERHATRLRLSRLYLFTPDKEGFYARLGWKRIEEMIYRGQKVVIMTKVFLR
jgi:GNAT superfamily N-acetyltransferase